MSVVLTVYSQDDPNDAFWLAQTYFMTHQFSRAERLLTRPFPTKSRAAEHPHPNGVDQSMLGTSAVRSFSLDTKGKGKETQPQHEPSARLPMGPAGLIKLPEALQENVSRLVDMSVACRYLAAQCQVRQGNWSDALEILGEANPFRHSGARLSLWLFHSANSWQAGVDHPFLTWMAASR